MAVGLPAMVAATVVATASRIEDAPGVALAVGAPADLVSSVSQEDLEPLKDYLEEAGVVIRGVTTTSARVLADRLVAGDIDVGVFAPVSYVRQHERYPSLVPFATHVVNGMRYMQGYVVVRQDSGIRDLAGLRGKRFAFTAPDAFGGHLFPTYALIRAGMRPRGFFSRTIMTKDYLESLRMVYEGRADGAGVLDEVLRLGEAIDIPKRAFRVLAKSRRVPFIAYVARPGLPQDTMHQVLRRLKGKRFKQLYLRATQPGLTRPRALARITPRRDARWSINGFVSCGDRDFDEVRRMLDVTAREALDVEESVTRP